MITKLVSENFKRVTAVTITPAGAGAVVIGGKNDQGKSSGGCDAIAFALGGAKHAPGAPLKEGAKKGGVVLETESIKVERTVTPKGIQLKVSGKDGARFASPQKMLDELMGPLSFDPLDFARRKGPEQAKLLSQLVGLDFSGENAARQEAYDERTDVGREIRRLQGALEKLPEPPTDTPDAEVSVAELAAELDAKNGINERNRLQRFDLETLRQLALKQKARADDLRAQLEAAENAFAHTQAKGKTLAAEVKALKDEDTDAIKARMATTEQTNRAVRDKATRDTMQAELDAAIDRSEALTKRIEEIDGVKASATAKAKYPIPGLAMTDDGVTLDGLPFEQASQSDRLKASVAIGLALNRGLKVLLVRDGALLDDGKLQLVGEMAAEAGAQVWVEVVGDRDGATVIIEDGEVKQCQ